MATEAPAPIQQEKRCLLGALLRKLVEVLERTPDSELRSTLKPIVSVYADVAKQLEEEQRNPEHGTRATSSA